MICNLPYIQKKELSQIWDSGFVKINRIDKVDNVGAYVIKYMVADMDDTRLMKEHAYLHSRALEEPVELTTWRGEAEAWKAVHEALDSMTPLYAGTYKSDESGTIQYLQYNINRKTKQVLKDGNGLQMTTND